MRSVGRTGQSGAFARRGRRFAPASASFLSNGHEKRAHHRWQRSDADAARPRAEKPEFMCARPTASRKQRCSGCLIFSIWYCWTCARDPKKQWSSGERFDASIQHSGSGSWLDLQRTCLLPAPTRSLPATRFLKTWGCRGGDSCLSRRALQTASSRLYADCTAGV
jgi:hypothetical protein